MIEDIVQVELGKLLDSVESLRREYPGKRFTLDGRLVGDIGEVLAQRRYEIDLPEGISPHYDAQTTDGKPVQIKATMNDSLTFPADHVPDHYLGLKINRDGSIVEVFNGPGTVIAKYLHDRVRSKNNQHHLSLKKLQELQQRVERKSVARRRESLTDEEVIEILNTGIIEQMEPGDQHNESTTMAEKETTNPK